jgi:hypothetical protein
MQKVKESATNVQDSRTLVIPKTEMSRKSTLDRLERYRRGETCGEPSRVFQHEIVDRCV